MGLNGIDVGTGHGQRSAILESIAIVHTVIAESAQIGIAEHRLGIAEVMPGSRAQPEGCVAVERHQRTEIACGFDGWIECAASQIAIAADAELVALLVHHPAKRLAQFGYFAVYRCCLQRFHVVHRYLLIHGQCIHIAIGIHRESPLAGVGCYHTIRVIVGQPYRIALTTGTSRTEQIVKVGVVPSRLQLPEVVLPLQVGVQAVLPGVVAPWRYAQRETDTAQSHGVVHGQAVAQHRCDMIPTVGIGKARDGGISPCKAHLLEHMVGGDMVVDIAKLDSGQRVVQQAHLFECVAVLLVGRLPIQLYGIGIGHHLAVECYRSHTVALKLQRQQLSGLYFERSKHSDAGIGKHLHLPGGDVDLPEVRHTGVVATAHEILIVERKAELSQVGIAPRHQFYRFVNGLLKLLEVKQQQGVFAVVALSGHRQPGAIVTHIDIKHTHAKRECIDGLDVLQIAIQTHHRLRAAV